MRGTVWLHEGWRRSSDVQHLAPWSEAAALDIHGKLLQCLHHSGSRGQAWSSKRNIISLQNKRSQPTSSAQSWPSISPQAEGTHT